LQVLDALSTLVFLNLGVQEGNPLIRVAFHYAGEPLEAMVIAKLFAIGLALLAWHSGRKRLLLKMDILFGLCLIWNLIIIVSRL
jgi:hypothetical protein